MLEERDIERHDLVSAHGLLPWDRARKLESEELLITWLLKCV
jgi:hypothetical protein